MKKLLPLILIATCGIANAQNTWTQKADFGGAERETAVGFSIGNKGYIGTGTDGGANFYKDFWEYDQATNAWTQKADFGGGGRMDAVGFAIANHGYFGTGMDSAGDYRKDFWEYDPALNTWTQKANFPGSVRECAACFSIGTKGYVGLGMDYNNNPVDFYEYDPLTNTWIQKADFPGPGRVLAVSFSIGNKGYLGTGTDDNSVCYNDFWEYDPAADVWTQKANFGGIPREGAVGFSIGNKGYIGLGEDFCGLGGIETDFWEYNPATNAWKNRATPISFPDMWAWAAGFSIGGKGYIGTGYHYMAPNQFTKELYEFTPDTANANCSANFTLYADTIPHTWIAVNSAGGTPPLTYSWSWGDGNFSSGPAPSHTYNTAGYYAICLTITDNTGCTDMYCDSSHYLFKGASGSAMVTVNVISSISTGTSSLTEENNSFVIYPNPSTGKIQLTYSTKHNAPLHCEIINIIGEKVFQSEIKNPQSAINMDVSFLAKGIYLMKVGDACLPDRQGKSFESKKLVIVQRTPYGE